MDKDITIAIVLIVFLLIFTKWMYATNKPNYEKSDNFKQIDNFEPETAFDNETNNQEGDETHGTSFYDENEEKNISKPDSKAQVIIFLSKSCPACISYNKNNYKRLKGKLEKLTNNKINIKKIYSDKDPNNLFSKYDIQFIPTGIVIHNNKSQKINGQISPSNTLKTIKQ